MRRRPITFIRQDKKFTLRQQNFILPKGEFHICKADISLPCRQADGRALQGCFYEKSGFFYFVFSDVL